MIDNLITHVHFIIPTNIGYNTVISMGEAGKDQLDDIIHDSTHTNEVCVAHECSYEEALLDILPQTNLYEYSVTSEVKDVTYTSEKFLAKLLQVSVNYDVSIHVDIRLSTESLKHKNLNYMKLKYPEFYKCWKHIHRENLGSVRNIESVFSDNDSDLFSFIFDDF